MKHVRVLLALLAAAMIAMPLEALAENRPMPTMTMRGHPLPIEGRLPSFAGVNAWLNSQPLTPEALRGKVVLVDFWSGQCVIPVSWHATTRSLPPGDWICAGRPSSTTSTSSSALALR